MTIKLDDVKAAVRDNRTVTFKYKGETRTVELTDLVTGPNAYVIGRDLNRDGDFRRFTVDNIDVLSTVN